MISNATDCEFKHLLFFAYTFSSLMFCKNLLDHQSSRLFADTAAIA